MPRTVKDESAKTKSGSSKAKSAKAESPSSSTTIRIQYYRSFIAAPKPHKEVVRSLGITKLNQIVERPDTPSMRGAVAKVPHLLRLVE